MKKLQIYFGDNKKEKHIATAYFEDSGELITIDTMEVFDNAIEIFKETHSPDDIRDEIMKSALRYQKELKK